MTRVWLTEWEWACCGEPFKVGDVVDFGIESRAPHPALADMIGPTLFATVDAVESHHEEDFADRVRGRVVAVNSVTHEVIEHRSVRHPGYGAPGDAVMPENGGEWPLVGRDLGNGVFVRSRPSRYVIEAVPVPNTAVLTAIDGMRLPLSEQDELLPPRTERTCDSSPPRSVRSPAGWLVDVEEL